MNSTRSRTSSNHIKFSHNKFSVGLYTKPQKVIELIMAIWNTRFGIMRNNELQMSDLKKKNDIKNVSVWSFVLSLCPSNLAIVCLIAFSMQNKNETIIPG